MRDPLLKWTSSGLYCPDGEFYIDPARSVARAVVTHAHLDHARSGSRQYLTAKDGAALVRSRLRGRPDVESLEYGETLTLGGVQVSLHPAGHMLGSAQVRVERDGEVWVVSGDYKLDPDPTCAAFEPVKCHTFITEATFARPGYVWPPAAGVFKEMAAWHRANVAAGRGSAIMAYAAGKAQRLLAGLAAEGLTVCAHAQIEEVNDQYRAAGIALPATISAKDLPPRATPLVLAPSAARGSAWWRRLGELRVAGASGWMCHPGSVARSRLDKGFVLSDHADWPGLLQAIAATEAEQVLVTHGESAPLIAHLGRMGCVAAELESVADVLF